MPRGGSSSTDTGATRRSSDDDGSEAASSNGRRTGTAPTSSAKKKQRGKSKTPTTAAAASSASSSRSSAARAASSRSRIRDRSRGAADNTSANVRSVSGSRSPDRTNGNAEDDMMEALSKADRAEAKMDEKYREWNDEQHQATNKRVDEVEKEVEKNAEDLKNFNETNERIKKKSSADGGGNGGDGALEMQQRYELRRIKSLVVGILFSDDPDAVKILQLSENSMEMAVLAIQSKLATKVDEDVLYSDRMTDAIQDVVRDYKRAASTTKSEGD